MTDDRRRMLTEEVIHYWVSSSRGTCWVCVRPDGIISDCAALWKKFKGQPFTNLIKWLRDAEVAEISKE